MKKKNNKKTKKSNKKNVRLPLIAFGIIVVFIISVLIFSTNGSFLVANIAGEREDAGVADLASTEEDPSEVGNAEIEVEDNPADVENPEIPSLQKASDPEVQAAKKKYKGSVGEFHDILKEQTGQPAKVLPYSKKLAKKYRNTACNATRKVTGQKNKYRKHKGYDFEFKQGQKIYAVYPGKVKSVHKKWYKNPDTGKYEGAIYIKNNHTDTDGAKYYSYGHLNKDKLKVKKGQKVDKGDLLGYIAYDHLDVKKSAKATIKPEERIRKGGTSGGLPKSKYKVW